MEQTDIRMILCDVDGTLLEKGKTQISQEVFSAIQVATENGIRFVIASGRCYTDLQKLFAPVQSSVTFVASDGGVAVQNGIILYSSFIPKELAADFIVSTGNQTSVLYGKDYQYIINAKNNSGTYQSVSHVKDACGEIYKIGFHGLQPFERQKVRSFASRSGKLTEVYQDTSWIEFVFAGTDKGVACHALQTQWNITPTETAAFGDNINDFGMLRQARLSFASPTAIPDIVRMCKYQTNHIVNQIIKLTQERGIL